MPPHLLLRICPVILTPAPLCSPQTLCSDAAPAARAAAGPAQAGDRRFHPLCSSGSTHGQGPARGQLAGSLLCCLPADEAARLKQPRGMHLRTAQPCCQVSGQQLPSALKHPLSPVCATLLQVFPWLRLVASLREPISRAVAVLASAKDEASQSCLAE